MINSTTLAEELALRGTCAGTTRGVSMEPLFRTNRDVVVIERPASELKKYDVALYRYPDGRYVLHRVIGVREDIYLIRGDNTFVVERIPKEWVIGVLVRFNRKGKSHSCEERGYRAYAVIWNFLYPVRYLCHLVRALLGRVKRWLFRKRRADDGKQ